MSDRLPTHILVSALLRRANDSGGMAMVLAKGDSQGGAILLILYDKSRYLGMAEPGRDRDGVPALQPTGPAESATSQDVTGYWQRRRASDRDLWVIDLDIPFAQRVAAETLLQR